MSNIIYQDVQSTCSKQFLEKYPHYTVPGHNLHSEKDVDEEDEIGAYTFPNNFLDPLPFLPPTEVSGSVWNGEDPVLNLVKKKFQWQKDLNNQKRNYSKQKKKSDISKTLQNILTTERKVLNLSTRDAHYIQHFSKNPDKEFDGGYNWYFTGGCLDKLEVNDMVLLMTTQGIANQQCCVIELDRKAQWKPKLTASQILKLHHPIYQLKASSKRSHICIRQHKFCTLYAFTEDMEFEKLHEGESTKPFTGVDISPHDSEKYCAITTSKYVREWNIDRNRATFKYKILSEDDLSDKWCSVSYSDDPNLFFVADRSCLHILDKRVTEQEVSQRIVPKNVPHLLNMCEEISLIVQSCKHLYAVYICTSHHVLLYDMRDDPTPLQRWTHQLCSPPLYGSILSYLNDHEVLCIANQEPGEIIVIENKWNGDLPCCNVQPLSLPNLQDTLLSANQNGLCLDPAVQHRLKLSLIGLTWLPPLSSGITLLTQTSASDVYSQLLTHPKNNTTVNEFECMKNWEETLLKQRKSITLNATSRESMENTVKYLKVSKKKESYTKKRKKKTYRTEPWMMSKEHMQGCIDLLAPRILEVWDIEKEPEWHKEKKEEKEISFASPPSPEPVDKVQAWLASVPDEQEVISISLPVFDPKLIAEKFKIKTKPINEQATLNDINDGSPYISVPLGTKFYSSTPINHGRKRNANTDNFTQDVSFLPQNKDLELPIQDNDDISDQISAVRSKKKKKVERKRSEIPIGF